jgi:hypothetical protein
VAGADIDRDDARELRIRPAVLDQGLVVESRRL